MRSDDKICYCYGVPLGKLLNFARRTRPQRPSRMSECLGAGTGCGWCIPFLIKIAENPDAFNLDNLAPEAYATRRKDYISAQPRNTFQTSRTEHSPEEIHRPSEPGAQATG